MPYILLKSPEWDFLCLQANAMLVVKGPSGVCLPACLRAGGEKKDKTSLPLRNLNNKTK